MITFKQFLYEIDHDDSVYTKAASDHVAKFPVDGWLDLMSIDGHKVVWTKAGNEYRVAMLDENGKPMFRLELLTKTVKVPGGTLTGVVTSSLSSKAEHRGKGLAAKIYEGLLDHGQVLFSSNSQTSGSRKLWEELVHRYHDQAFVLAQHPAADWYIKKYGDESHASGYNAGVLLRGSIERMIDEAYASHETRWLLIPKDIAGLNKLRANAIELT